MPTRDDYLTQIDADLKAQTEPAKVLKARRTKVKAAKDDDDARVAYLEHVEDAADA